METPHIGDHRSNNHKASESVPAERMETFLHGVQQNEYIFAPIKNTAFRRRKRRRQICRLILQREPDQTMILTRN